MKRALVAILLSVGLVSTASAQVTNWTSFTSFSQSGPQENLGGTSGRQGVSSVVMNNSLWVAYVSASDGNLIRVANAATGIGYSLSIGREVVTGGAPVYSNNNPALTSDGTYLYLGFLNTGNQFELLQSNANPGNTGILTWTYLGVYTPPSGSLIFSPSLAVMNVGGNPTLFMSVTGDNRSLYLGRVGAGGNLSFASWTNTPGANIGMAPGLGVFNNTLYIAFPTNANDHKLYYYTTTDGVSLSYHTNANFDSSSTSPSLLAFGGHFYMAFRSNDGDHKFDYISTTDGVNWGNHRSISVSMAGPPALSDGSTLISDPGHLICNFAGDNSSHYLFGGESQ